MSLPQSDLVWRWQLTLRERFAGFRFVRSTAEQTKIGIEVRPFLQRNDPLPGHPGLTYRFGLAHAGAALGDIARIREAQPGLPHTGDDRSGIVVFDGQTPIASYTVYGRESAPRHRMFVTSPYRGRGLPVVILLEWYKRTMRVREMTPQVMNGGGVKVFLAAQVAVTEWAIASGQSVPAAVRASLGPDSEYLIDLAAQVDASGEAVVVSAPALP